MRIYGFHAPQERLGPRFFTSEQDYENVNTGRFVRNAVLDGMTYGSNDLVPAFLKTCDAIHPMCGAEDIDGVTQSCYGALLDSVNSATTKAAIKSVVQPWNTSEVWAPGGTGVGQWLAVKLPEATLVERYVLVSTMTTCPLSFKVQGSLDGSTWADLHNVENSGEWEAAYSEKVFTIPAETRGTYLWYRIYITASNATTMSIRTFRLWRAQSVCDRGQLLLDASAGNPLILSFMDGFAVDNVTPVDHTESLSSPLLEAIGYFDTIGTPLSGSNLPVPIGIYAKRTSSGSVSIEINAAAETDMPYFPARMTAYQQNGMLVTSDTVIGSAYCEAYSRWGAGYAYNTEQKRAPKSTLKRDDGSPFFVSKTYGYNLGSQAVDWRLYVEELDGSMSPLPTMEGNGPSAMATNNLNRYVKSLRYIQDVTELGGYHSSAVYGRRFPLNYRFSPGKVWQKETADTEWEAVQKIKIGEAVYYNGDIYQVLPKSATLQQWMSNTGLEM